MRLLHIVATPRGLGSNTGRVSSALLQALCDQNNEIDVRTLDLFAADLPAVAGTNIESKYKLMTGQDLDADAISSWRQIETAITQFLAADAYVLTTPMWNFGVPYVLKYYIDAIVQPGYLFKYDEHGYPHGLVTGRKMLVVTSRGGDYSAGPMQQFDFLENYLRAIFGFCGLTDMTFFNAQPMDVSLDLRRDATRRAIDEVRAFVATSDWAKPSQNVAELTLPEGLKPAPIEEPAPTVA